MTHLLTWLAAAAEQAVRTTRSVAMAFLASIAFMVGRVSAGRTRVFHVRGLTSGLTGVPRDRSGSEAKGHCGASVLYSLLDRIAIFAFMGMTEADRPPEVHLRAVIVISVWPGDSGGHDPP